MWQPEPTKFGEVLLGDVGYIRQGCFFRLFNTMRPADDPANQNGVPEGFEVFQLNPLLLHSRDEYLKPGVICSSSVQKTDVQAQGGAGSR